MSNGHYLDKIKLNRWLNIRKTTLEVLNKNLKGELNFKVTIENCESLDTYAIDVIAKFLDISSSKLKKITNFQHIYLNQN